MIKLTIITVGKKVPAWIQAGYQEYYKRLPRELNLRLVEIPSARRFKNASIDKLLQQEAKTLLREIPKNTRIILLDERGKKQTTLRLSNELRVWIDTGQDYCFIIGGADGVHGTVFDAADERWSLSDYTLPHALVRVFLIEQIYRAWCILTNHPYHRE